MFIWPVGLLIPHSTLLLHVHFQHLYHQCPELVLAQPGSWRFLCLKATSGNPRIPASEQAEISLVPGQTRSVPLPNLVHSFPEQCSLGTWVTASAPSVAGSAPFSLRRLGSWKAPVVHFPLVHCFRACQLCPVLPLYLRGASPKDSSFTQTAETSKHRAKPHAYRFMQMSI